MIFEIENIPQGNLRCRLKNHPMISVYYFSTQGTELFDNLYNLDSSFSKLNTKDKVTYLLYGSTSNSNSLSKDFTEHVILFLKSTGHSF